MSSKFDCLLDLIEPLKTDSFGEWHIDREHKGTEDDPIQFPFPAYTETVHRLIDAIYEIERNCPEFELTKYHDILEEHGIEWGSNSMENANVSGMDLQGVLALIMGIVRAERFCDGAILGALNSEAVLRWLERLKEIVDSNS